MKGLFNRLLNEFSDKEYAHSYMESHAVSRIAAQIHALRKQRGWSQEDLAKKSGVAQERISKIESADFDSITMKTLQKFSRAFDVNLHITFQPFSEGMIDVSNLAREKLEVQSRAEDLASGFAGYMHQGGWNSTFVKKRSFGVEDYISTESKSYAASNDAIINSFEVAA